MNNDLEIENQMLKEELMVRGNFTLREKMLI